MTTTTRLIGREPNQVPLNAYLGRMAYLDPDNLPELGFTTAATVINLDREELEALGPVFLASIFDLESGELATTDLEVNAQNRPRAVTIGGLNYWREYNSLLSARDLAFETGTDADEYPVSGMLGRLAFIDEWCGYASGGGTAVQETSKTTTVVLNRTCGQLTLDDEELADATTAVFTLTNSQIAPSDVVNVSIKSGATAGAYLVGVTETGIGSCKVFIRNVSGAALSEAVVLNFIIIKSTTTTV
jgi:hypothetical protein